jgi:hypothetical protein
MEGWDIRTPFAFRIATDVTGRHGMNRWASGERRMSDLPNRLTGNPKNRRAGRQTVCEMFVVLPYR